MPLFIDDDDEEEDDGEEEDEDTPPVGKLFVGRGEEDPCKSFPSLSHRIVIGGSPLITEHNIFPLDPSSKNFGKENGSITGAPKYTKIGLYCIYCNNIMI